jgi:hypothetical protein
VKFGGDTGAEPEDDWTASHSQLVEKSALTQARRDVRDRGFERLATHSESPRLASFDLLSLLD